MCPPGVVVAVPFTMVGDDRPLKDGVTWMVSDTVAGLLLKWPLLTLNWKLSGPP